MSVCDHAHTAEVETSHGVSILVLVDVGLRFSTMVPYTQTYYSFNPCFSGCRSAIGKKVPYDAGIQMFQSLF